MAMTNKSRRELYSAWWALRLTFGLVPFLAGLDKFFNILTDWAQYQSPLLQQFLPISATSFMYVIGIIEIVVGLAILTRWTCRPATWQWSGSWQLLPTCSRPAGTLTSLCVIWLLPSPRIRSRY